MSFKRRNKRKLSTRSADSLHLAFRTFQVRASSINLDTRTVDAVVTTESPVLMPDYERGEMVPEVLLTSGASLPPSGQVPLLDSHQRKATEDQVGSVRGLTKNSADITGTLHFASASDRQWSKVREGHITDVSAGYRVEHKVFVKAGETRSVGGTKFTGPVNVVDKWRLYEVSVLPIGADQQAKLRGFDPTAIQSHDLELKMNKELFAWCVKRGMSADLDEAAAIKWHAENSARLYAETVPVVVDPPVGNRGDKTDGQEPLTAAKLAEFLDKRDADRAAIDKARKLEIDELCALAELPDFAAEARGFDTVAEARAFIVAKKAAIAAGTALRPSANIRVVGDTGRATFLADVGTALNLRAIDAAVSHAPDHSRQTQEEIEKRVNYAKEKAFPAAQRSKGADRWKAASLMQMAEECLRIDGVDTRGMTRDEIARATFDPETARQFSSRASGPALNTTGGFTNLTLDAVNKSMMVGYTEAPSTWEGPMRRGESVPDFKQIHRIRMGAIPNMPIWPDDQDPTKARFADSQEKYVVESRSLEIGFSYKLLVNDDMSALTRVPAMMGNSARRTVNAVAWGVLTSNPIMASDSVALLSAATGARKRSNKTTGANLPTTANVQVSQNLMMQMRGENTPEGNEGPDILALMPKYLVGPSALYQSIVVLTRSTFDPVVNEFQFYNIASQLTGVIEPLLDATSTTAWFLFADPSQIDTIEVSFLQGQETPVVRNWIDPRNLVQQFTILQTFGAAAMNHRGIQQQVGV